MAKQSGGVMHWPHWPHWLHWPHLFLCPWLGDNSAAIRFPPHRNQKDSKKLHLNLSICYKELKRPNVHCNLCMPFTE